MPGNGGPANPAVLNTTVLSNFAYVDRVDLPGDLAGICTVPAVRDELADGVSSHSFLRSALDRLDNGIPVAPIPDPVAHREGVLRSTLDPGEAQAFALADVRNGRLLTDDGDAREFATAEGVTVIGSVGVLLAAIESGRVDESTANGWLSTWIDETGYYVPYRELSEYR